MRINEAKIRQMAQQVATSTFHTLLSKIDIEVRHDVALAASKDAGDAFGHALTLTLRDNGVNIIPEGKKRAA